VKQKAKSCELIRDQIESKIMTKLFDNKYRFIKDLGFGGFGEVFLAKEVRSQNFVAIKQLKNKDKRKQDDLIYEMQMVSKFNHPNTI
jgi:serine/threonine protein kinase